MVALFIQPAQFLGPFSLRKILISSNQRLTIFGLMLQVKMTKFGSITFEVYGAFSPKKV